MMTTSERIFRAVVVLACVLPCGVSVAAETLLEDEFDFFELGETWQEHEDGEPDIFLGVIGDGLLQMQSSGFAEEFRGIETIAPISLAGLSSLTVDARLQPINMGVEGAISAAEVALIGASGEYIRAFASNNAGPDPESENDWADHYEDSMGSTATSGPWPHCESPACDAMRDFVITVSAAGTTFQSFDDEEELDDDDNWIPTFEMTFEDFTLADLGSSVTIALRQQTVEGGDEVMGFFDAIWVTGEEGAGILGDYDVSGVLDAGDLDLQAIAITEGNHPTEYDLTNDGLVDYDDRQTWVDQLKNTWIGDANLDGEFNSGDMVQVFVRGKYERDVDAGWEEGDWNGDRKFGSSDMVAAFAAGGYEQGDRPAAAVSAVPEPSSLVLLILAGIACTVLRRR